MQYLTLDNSIKDLTHFARTVKLPFDKHGQSNAQHAPWVQMGCSYSSALAAWTAVLDPGTYWAYHVSSGPVQVSANYWEYYLPIQRGMPQNCSKDVSLVIDYVDDILIHGSKKQQQELKAMFKLERLEHNDDFALAMSLAIDQWQLTDFDFPNSFYEFCDYVENVEHASGTKKIPGEEGVGLEKALAGYAKWMVDIKLPGYCEGRYGSSYFTGDDNLGCLDSYDKTSPIYTDLAPNNTAYRAWQWILCNEPFEYWEDGAPQNRPTIISRLLNVDYWTRQCGLYFPDGPHGETYGLRKGRTPKQVNARTGGWNMVNTTRVMHVNGEFDPWREGSVSATVRPGGPLKSTKQVPVELVPGGRHCSDLYTSNGEVNAGVKASQDRILKQFAEWVAEWPGKGASEE